MKRTVIDTRRNVSSCFIGRSYISDSCSTWGFLPRGGNSVLHPRSTPPRFGGFGKPAPSPSSTPAAPFPMQVATVSLGGDVEGRREEGPVPTTHGFHWQWRNERLSRTCAWGCACFCGHRNTATSWSALPTPGSQCALLFRARGRRHSKWLTPPWVSAVSSREPAQSAWPGLTLQPFQQLLSVIRRSGVPGVPPENEFPEVPTAGMGFCRKLY